MKDADLSDCLYVQVDLHLCCMKMTSGFLMKQLIKEAVKNKMSLVVRKPVFGVSDQVQHKPGCPAIEDDYRLEISDLGSRGIFTIRAAKTNALISFAVIAKLICAFVFAYAKSRFSHNEAKISWNKASQTKFVVVRSVFML